MVEVCIFGDLDLVEVWILLRIGFGRGMNLFGVWIW